MYNKLFKMFCLNGFDLIMLPQFQTLNRELAIDACTGSPASNLNGQKFEFFGKLEVSFTVVYEEHPVQNETS